MMLRDDELISLIDIVLDLEISSSTSNDLRDFKRQAQAGTILADDRQYAAALCRRLLRKTEQQLISAPGKHRLTKLCERVSLRMLENAAMDDPFVFRANYAEGSKRTDTSENDRRWSAWMADVEHPKRSTILQMIVSLAATDFWKEANNITDNPDWGVAENPFKNTNSDVIVAEALMFFWYNFFLFVRQAVKKNEFTEADNQAVSIAGTTIGHIIKETTQWPIGEILSLRVDEYNHRDKTENPTDVFSRVVLRSIGKQVINERDRDFDHLSLDAAPIMMRTAIHMTAKLPAYFEVYKNIVAHYPMD